MRSQDIHVPKGTVAAAAKRFTKQEAKLAPVAPTTPEQLQHRPIKGDESAFTTPDDSTAGASTATPSTADSSIWGDSSAGTPMDADHERVLYPEVLSSALAAKASLEMDLLDLRQELSRRQSEFSQRLDSEHMWCSETVQQAADMACALRDANHVLAAEADQLRSRVEQLEKEAKTTSAALSNANAHDQGNEQMIAALQIELGDLQRQLHKALRARNSAAETEEAALQRGEILQGQLEQMAALLEAERKERMKAEAALEMCKQQLAEATEDFSLP